MRCNSAVVTWLLLSSSIHALLVERTAITWFLAVGGIFGSIDGGSSATMRSDGRFVLWGKRSTVVPVAGDRGSPREWDGCK
jgi:hypothetical protein